MKRVRMTVALVSAALVSTAALTGCEVEKKTTNKTPVVPSEMPDFGYGSPLQEVSNNQIFFTNKFFLWKELPAGASQADIDREALVRARVISAGDRVDELDDKGGDISKRIGDLDIELDRFNDVVLPEKTKGLAAELKTAFDNYISLKREFAKANSDEEHRYNIGRFKLDLKSAEADMSRAATAQAQSLKDDLKQLVALALQKAELLEAGDDARRAELQTQIDAIQARLPAELPKGLKDAKSRAEEAMGKLEGTYYDRLRSLELPGLIAAEAETLKALTGDAAAARSQFDATVAERAAKFHEGFVVGKESTELTDLVIASTDYFESMPSRVAFNFFPGNRVSITVRSFPRKDDNLEFSTENGGIRNVSFDSRGTVLRFELWSGDAEFYKFRISENRLNRRTDKRHFYQGTMDYNYLDAVTGEWKLRRGQAKLAPSN